jgi:hypothetical protein
MGYGLRVYNSSGTLILDFTDEISRLRFSEVVAANASGSTSLPDISGSSTAQFAMCRETDKLPHVVTRSGTTIEWAPQSMEYRASGESMVLVFMYT